MAKSSAVLQPGLGLYLGQPPLFTPLQALQDCLNVRIKNQVIVRDNIGYGPFPQGAASPLNLDGLPVTLIDNFFPRSGGQILIFGNTRDLFEFDEASGTLRYLTPRYQFANVLVTHNSATVTGVSTLWSANVKAGDKIHFGMAGQRSQSATWYTVQSVASNTQLTLTTPFTGATASTVPYTVRSLFTGEIEDHFETAVFYDAEAVHSGADGDRWYATNGVDKVVAWDGIAGQVYRLTDLDTCRSLAVHSNIMAYINIVQSGENRRASIRTSAIGQPENVSTQEASEFIIHDGSDSLLTAFTLGENLVIYGARSITIAQYVGPPVQFVFRTVVDGIGVRAARGIADYGDYHAFLGSDAQYIFDGVSISESDSHVWREIIRQSNPGKLGLINSHFDEENGELLWSIPLNTDSGIGPGYVFVEHYLEDTGKDGSPGIYTKRKLPATAFGFYERISTLTFDQMPLPFSSYNFRFDDQALQAAFPYNLMGDETGNLYILNTQDTANGTPLRSFVRFGRRALGSIEAKGIIRRIYPLMEELQGGSHDIKVEIFTANTSGGTAGLSATHSFPLTVSGDRHFISPRLTARYAELQFSTEGEGEYWTMLGYDMDVVPGGDR